MSPFPFQAINRGLFINDPESMVIGVLDIYGFEIFAVKEKYIKIQKNTKNGRKKKNTTS